MNKFKQRTLLEYFTFAILSGVISWWFFGGAAYAVWMAAYHTDSEIIRNWKARFYANVFVGISLLLLLTIGLLRLPESSKGENENQVQNKEPTV